MVPECVADSYLDLKLTSSCRVFFECESKSEVASAVGFIGHDEDLIELRMIGFEPTRTELAALARVFLNSNRFVLSLFIQRGFICILVLLCTIG